MSTSGVPGENMFIHTFVYVIFTSFKGGKTNFTSLAHFLETIEKLTEKLIFSISDLPLGSYGLYKVRNSTILAQKNS